MPEVRPGSSASAFGRRVSGNAARVSDGCRRGRERDRARRVKELELHSFPGWKLFGRFQVFKFPKLTKKVSHQNRITRKQVEQKLFVFVRKVGSATICIDPSFKKKILMNYLNLNKRKTIPLEIFRLLIKILALQTKLSFSKILTLFLIKILLIQTMNK